MNGSVRANEGPRGGASAECRAGRAFATYAGDGGGGGGGVNMLQQQQRQGRLSWNLNGAGTMCLGGRPGRRCGGCNSPIASLRDAGGRKRSQPAEGPAAAEGRSLAVMVVTVTVPGRTSEGARQTDLSAVTDHGPAAGTSESPDPSPRLAGCGMVRS